MTNPTPPPAAQPLTPSAEALKQELHSLVKLLADAQEALSRATAAERAQRPRQTTRCHACGSCHDGKLEATAGAQEDRTDRTRTLLAQSTASTCGYLAQELAAAAVTVAVWAYHEVRAGEVEPFPAEREAYALVALAQQRVADATEQCQQQSSERFARGLAAL